MQLVEWFDERQAAEWLAVPEATVQDAVRAGAIPALRIGGLVRISRAALLGLGAGMNGAPKSAGYSQARSATATPTGGLPVPRGLAWVEDLRPTDKFEYMWPNALQEEYPTAMEGVVTLNGERFIVKVGVGVRPIGLAKGQTQEMRGRLVVFLAGYPLCEFVKTPDGEAWASIIKPDGKKTVAPGTPPPPLYEAARLMPYREATGTGGIGVPNGLALVIDSDDYRSAVHHAAARRLGREHHPVEPA